MLTFNLKKEWFEKIKSGKKTHEYRLANKYWQNRIYNLIRKYDGNFSAKWAKICMEDKTGRGNFSIPIEKCLIKFCLGYPRKDDKEKFMLAKVTRVSRTIKGKFTDLKIDAPVFDIEFELVKE